MAYSVVIVGFEADYSEQIRQLLEYSGSTSRVRILDEDTIRSSLSENQPCWDVVDITVVNGDNPDHPDWLVDCWSQHSVQPSASLIIGDKQPGRTWSGEERRQAPRLYINSSELTGVSLSRAIRKLDKASQYAHHEKSASQYSRVGLDVTNGQQGVVQDLYLNDGILPNGDPTIQFGTAIVGGYRIKRLLGHGGMATVYEAETGDGKTVALKLLDVECIRDEREIDRFIEEYEIITTLDHPNIVDVYEQGFTDDHMFIAMQYLEGETLKSRFNRGAITPVNAIQYIIDLSGALGMIHDRGILHRDIKPNNIMFDGMDRPVLTDFGIAKILNGPHMASITIAGEAVGTPTYMSPEQAQGKTLSRSSDLYSLGVLFYRLLTGELPFKAHTAVELMRQHVEAPLPELPPLLEELNPVMQRLLAKEPRDRYQTANELRWDLLPYRM